MGTTITTNRLAVQQQIISKFRLAVLIASWLAPISLYAIQRTEDVTILRSDERSLVFEYKPQSARSRRSVIVQNSIREGVHPMGCFLLGANAKSGLRDFTLDFRIGEPYILPLTFLFQRRVSVLYPVR